MKNKIWVYEKNNNSKTLKLLYKHNINVYQIKDFNNQSIYLINKNDYKKLKYIYLLNFKIYKNSLYDEIVSYIKKNIIYISSFIMTIVEIIFLSKVIVNVQIVHSDKYIRELLAYELKQYDLSRLKLKKDRKQLDIIKEHILDDNKDYLEWLEIENVGMKYVVKVEERIIPYHSKKNTYCNIVAQKNGNIINYSVSSGNLNVSIGDYVHKGDILISGDIIFNDKVVNKVCADGNVYSETWYKLKVSVPIYKNDYEYTGKERWNFSVSFNNNNYKILRSRIKNFKTQKKKIGSIFGITFYLDKEKEIKVQKIRLSEKDITLLAIEKGLNSLNVSLNNKSDIISQKVLKKSIKDSTMYLELFVSVRENISKIQVIE